jgi:hypothetical protein
MSFTSSSGHFSKNARAQTSSTSCPISVSKIVGMAIYWFSSWVRQSVKVNKLKITTKYLDKRLKRVVIFLYLNNVEHLPS